MDLARGLALLVSPGAILAVLTVWATILAGRRGPWRWAAVAGACLLVVLRGRSLARIIQANEIFDMLVFWNVGQAIWRGGDPYALQGEGGQSILNPPTALPLFAAFALVPLPTLNFLWRIFNLLAGAALVPLSRVVLAAEDGPTPPRPATTTMLQAGCLAAVVVASDSSVSVFTTGQLAIFGALMILLALWARGWGRPLLAGLALAVTTSKVATMLPFLILLRRRSDRLVWAGLVAGTIGLCLLPGRPGELPGWISSNLGHIRNFSRAGQVNDYAFEGRENYSIVALDHGFYRLGLRDRGAIAAAQAVALGALGIGVAWQVWRGGMAPGASCALVGLYSMVFLYHRLYDLSLLALPLTYVVGRAAATRGRALWLHAAAATAIVLALCVAQRRLTELTDQIRNAGGVAARLVQAVVLPYPLWMILIAMACLWAAERRDRVTPSDVRDVPIPAGA